MSLSPSDLGDPVEKGDVDIEANTSPLAKTKSKAGTIVDIPQLQDSSYSDSIPVTDLDKNIVGWESQDDPEFPRNFPRYRKWLLVMLHSVNKFMNPFALNIYAPVLSSIADEYRIHNETVGEMPMSILILGYAIGPIFLGPLSEIYGRHIVLLIANAFFCIFLLGCALSPSLELLIVFRFLCGVGGSASTSVSGAIITDMFPVHERGRPMTVWTLITMLGPTLGPVFGALVTQHLGWRWVNWISFIPSSCALIALAAFGRETNYRVLIDRKIRKLQKKEDQKPALSEPLRNCYVDPYAPQLTQCQIIRQGFCRPLKILFTSPIICSISFCFAFANGCLYLLLNRIPRDFEATYHWSLQRTGLVYFAFFIGNAFGLAMTYAISDRMVIRKTAANNGIHEPEMRLHGCTWFAIAMPITFFWYGWAAEAKAHWSVVILGLVPFGFGNAGEWLLLQTYCADAYPEYAASSLAAFNMTRYVVSAFLPLAGPRLYDKLGTGWGSSVLGFIALAMVPVPWVVRRYGACLRKRFSVRL